MRIRKRQVPFPLWPVTHSDPNLISRSPVMVQLNDATTTSPKPSCTHGSPTAPSPLSDRPQPSDQPLPPIGKPTNGSDESSGEGGTRYLRQQHKKQESWVEDGGREEVGGQKGNDTRKGSISCSETPPETFSSSSRPKQDGRWCEGDKAFPLKKRRGSFENATKDINNNEDNDNNNDKKSSKMKTKRRMKAKMNKECSRRDNSKEGEEEMNEEEVTRETKPEVNVGKKRVKGGALMEGSRCSRVNGRGWRCCQQTLVGYSLCEHHLGKGRLRSMTSVRNKSIGTTSGAPKINNMPQSEPSCEKQTTKCSYSVTEVPLGNDGEDNDEKPLMVTKRRMKLGMVKARSISSLLGQTNTEINVAVAEDNNNNNNNK